jgi:hypothetical protein
VAERVEALDDSQSEASASSWTIELKPQPDRMSWRFGFANDFMFDADNQFTNEFTFQKHSSVSENLDDLRGKFMFGHGLARKLLPQKGGLVYRTAISVGQSMHTPDAIEESNIILDDTPYLGFLAASRSWIGFNDDEFTGFATTIGVVGEASLAEPVQRQIHSLVGATRPRGWDNQIGNEPVLNFYFTRKSKFLNTPSFDASVRTDIAAGNYHTGINAGLEMRFGRRPMGFLNNYDPLGQGMFYDSSLARKDGRTDMYLSFSANVWARAIFMPLEGNTLVGGNEWTRNNTIDPKNVIGKVATGLHYVRPTWGLHFTLTFSTDSVDPASVRHGVDTDDDFGTLTFDWQF